MKLETQLKEYSAETFFKEKKIFLRMLDKENIKRGKSRIEKNFDAIYELNRIFKFKPHNYEELLSRCNSIEKFLKYLDNNIIKLKFIPAIDIFFELIIKYSSKAIELNPKCEEAYWYRGYAKYQLKDYKGTINDFSKVIQSNPNCEYAFLKRGDVKLKLKEYESAIEDYSYVIKINSNSANAFFLRGSAKKDKGKFLEALKDYSQAILLDPRNDMFLAKRAELKGDLGDYEGGLKDYKMVLKLNPNKSVIYIDIDRLKTKLNQKINKLSKLEGEFITDNISKLINDNFKNRLIKESN